MRNKTAILAFIAALALTGCGDVSKAVDVPQETTTTAVTTTVKEDIETTTSYDQIKLIGEKSTDSSVCLIDIVNKTNKDIVSFTVKSDLDEDFSSNMIDEKDPYKKDEMRLMFFTPEEEDTISYDDDDRTASVGYTIKLEFSDKKTAELHQFPYKEMEKAELYYENGIAYLKYTVKDSDEVVSTKDAEEMYKANEPATEADPETQSEEPADKNEPATQPAVQEPVYVEPTTQEPVYVEPTTPEPVYTEPATEPPTEYDPNAGCLGGLFD